MAKTMRTAYLLKPKTIEIREVADPAPRDGELVIRVERALTCGTDLKAYQRGHPLIPMPGPFGHQYAGTVHTAGAGVQGFEPGQPVWGVHSAPCGACVQCARGRYSLCPRLAEDMAFGAFAQYLRLPARVVGKNLLPRPAGMPLERAAFLEPVSCIVHALERIDWHGVDRVLVLGLGSMGLLFCQVLPRFSHASVVAAGRNPQRLAIARGYGLERVLDARQEPLDDAGFDCVIECTGREQGWRVAFDAALPGGQVLFFGGLPRGTQFSVDTYKVHYGELRLLGAFHLGPPDVRRAAELLEHGELHVGDLISGEIGLGGLDAALRQMEAGAGIKYALDPWS
ncbi:MAG: alcohol dehydrogenase catalytic domain-containing protein [Gammaproteobacteria bacterium]|nr:MAG: alcohol dehydrogenase catalytic domain-containing protein [Gammaproteobacteria bacterium]